jgi:hypothetical protein
VDTDHAKTDTSVDSDHIETQRHRQRQDHMWTQKQTHSQGWLTRKAHNFNFNFISFPLILIGLSQPKDIEQVKNTYIYK